MWLPACSATIFLSCCHNKSIFFVVITGKETRGRGFHCIKVFLILIEKLEKGGKQNVEDKK